MLQYLSRWKVGGEENTSIFTDDVDEIMVACCEYTPFPVIQAQAHARLIAAAPEMLEALEQIAKGEGHFSRDQLTHCQNTLEDMKAVARAAIAKAKGKS